VDVGEEPVEIVDEDDRVVEIVSRRAMREGHRLHRCTYVIVTDGDGRVYLHRRTDTKDVYAGRYDLTAGGVNGVGETYAQAAAREVAEELGVTAEPIFRFLHRYDGPDGTCWGGTFDVTWDGPVVWQPEEVAWGTFVTLEEADEWIAREPFCPDGLEVFERWRRWDGMRTAVAADVETVTDVIRQAFEHYVARIGKVPAPMLEDQAASIARSQTYVLDDGSGVIVLIPEADHLLVRDVAVHPSAQGRGLGTRLMAFAELRTRELGLGELRLYTNEAMWENLRFYPRLGYRETERYEEDGYRRVGFAKAVPSSAPVAGRPSGPA
jgi:8-oxo-dGTP pyrophosphatase MutT (NUDIX family)